MMNPVSKYRLDPPRYPIIFSFRIVIVIEDGEGDLCKLFVFFPQSTVLSYWIIR